MSDSVSLGDILRKRYTTDFIKQLASLGDDREQVIARVADAVRDSSPTFEELVDVEAKLGDKGWTLSSWIADQLTPTLNEVFTDDDE